MPIDVYILGRRASYKQGIVGGVGIDPVDVHVDHDDPILTRLDLNGRGKNQV